MRAAWWWIDRWRKSTAYTDMTAEAQGVYRNLLDELWLRGGVIPSDERILAKIGGDPEAWPRVREVVLARFLATPEGLRNETHDEVMAGTVAAINRQRVKGIIRAEKASRNPAGKFQPHQPGASRTASRKASRNASRDTSLPSPDPDPDPSVPFPSLPSVATGTGEPPPAVAAEAPLKPEVLTGNGAWPGDWSRRIVDITREHGEAPPGPVLKALKALETRWPFDGVERGWRAYCEAGKLEFGAGPFVRSARQWIEDGGPLSPQRQREKRSDEALRRFMEGVEP